jgi:hypothetical protein
MELWWDCFLYICQFNQAAMQVWGYLFFFWWPPLPHDLTIYACAVWQNSFILCSRATAASHWLSFWSSQEDVEKDPEVVEA